MVTRTILSEPNMHGCARASNRARTIRSCTTDRYVFDRLRFFEHGHARSYCNGHASLSSQFFIIDGHTAQLVTIDVQAAIL